MLENNGKMSQAQEVRAQAFFMARNHSKGYELSPQETMELALELEAWLWKAEGDNNLRELLASSYALAEYIEVGKAGDVPDLQRFYRAYSAFDTGLKPTKSVRR